MPTRERAAQLRAWCRGGPGGRPSAPVAPTMIGSAIVRESRFAWSREKRRQRAAARVTPLRETPGRQRRRLGDAEREAVGRGRVAAPAPLRPAVGDEHRRRPGEQAVGGRPRPAEAPLDRPLQRVADDRRRQEGEAEQQRPAAVELAQLLGDHPPLADQQRRRGAGVERHLEALAQLGVDLLPVPAGQPGDEDDVGRAGDRQQLGRALDDAERDRAARSGGRSSLARAGRLGVGGLRPRPGRRRGAA